MVTSEAEHDGGTEGICRQVSYESEHERHYFWSNGGKILDHARHSQTEDDLEPSHLARDRCAFLAVREGSPWRKIWNLIVAAILVYTGTLFPYRLCFVEFKMPTPADSATLWTTLELCVDGLFWGDLLFNFFFTYKDKDGNEVTDLCRISVRYLRSFFMLNLLACLPPEAFTAMVDWLSSSDTSDEGVSASVNKSLRLIRLQRISRLARLARLTRLVKMVTFVAESPVWAWVQSLRGVRVLNFFFGLVWAVHLLACGWYLTAALHDNHLRTWVARRTVDDLGDTPLTLMDESSVVQWAHAMYFVLTVFTTVGFGDISAVTTGEILYVCFAMIVGAVVHSIIVSEMINTITSVDQTAVFRSKQKELVETWANQVDLNPRCTQALVRWTKVSEQMKQGYDRDEMRKLLTECTLPNHLLTEVSTGVFAGRLMENAFIAGTNKSRQHFVPMRFPLLLALAITQRFCARGEVVYYCYDHAWNLFLVMTGTFANIGKPADSGGISELPPKLVRASEDADDNVSSQRTTPKGGNESLRGSIDLVLDVSREDINNVLAMEEKATLYPYQLFGAGNYFGEAELFVDQRPRQSTVRCEGHKQGGSLLVLHKNDICMVGEEFPHIAWMWRSAARRREGHRKALLNRLTRGRSYRHFAAWIIQRAIRRRLRGKSQIGLGSSDKPRGCPRSMSCGGASSPFARKIMLGVSESPMLGVTDSGLEATTRKYSADKADGSQDHDREKEDNHRQLRGDVDSLRQEVSDMKNLMMSLRDDVLQAVSCKPTMRHKPDMLSL